MNSQTPSAYKRKSEITKRNQQQRRRARTLILTFIVIAVGITVLCVALMGMISYYNKNQEEKTGNTIIFHEADYDYDIMQNSEYLALDRNIKFENPETGITIEIIDGNLEDVPAIFHDSVSLIIDYVNYAIGGETDSLNALFSDEYVEADGKLKMDFTMQQLYNIKITYVASLSTETDGYSYPSYDYWLEYMIHKNNGTFRSDLGSDCTRKEYVRVTDRNGRLGIDVLAPYVTQERQQQTLSGARIASLIVVSAAIITVFGLVCWFITKKSRKNI